MLSVYTRHWQKCCHRNDIARRRLSLPKMDSAHSPQGTEIHSDRRRGISNHKKLLDSSANLEEFDVSSPDKTIS